MQMNVYVYMLGSINIQNLAESKENILKDSESIFASFNFFDQCFIENILFCIKEFTILLHYHCGQDFIVSALHFVSRSS